MKVLMIAYACSPEGTGEHWLGWGWAEQAAKQHRVYLLTTTNAREAVERHAAAHGIQPRFVPLSDALRTVTERFGRAGAWLRKVVWAYKSARVAAEWHQAEKFSLVHQTTFHTFRIPFLATRLGIPSVWGPIAGGEHVPSGYYRFIGPTTTRITEYVRGILNHVWLAWPAVRESLRRTDVIFASNRTTLQFLGSEAAAKSRIMPPNALRPEDEMAVGIRTKEERTVFRLLYIGNCAPTRAMPIVFAAMAEAKLSRCQLTIIGTGSALQFWQTQAARYGVEKQVKFLGQRPHAELGKYYVHSDVLVFPALRDSGGSALLEAMSKGLPVICLDWAGPSEMVDEKSGVKIPVTTPRHTIQAFAEALVRLERDPQLRNELGEGAVERAREGFSWAAKREALATTYRRLLSPP